MPQRPLYLKQLELGPMQNFIYLIGDPATHEAAVVDPGWEVPKILEALHHDDYRLTRVFLTHSHFDHVGGLGELLKTADVPVHANRTELPTLKPYAEALKPTGHGEVVQVGTVPIQLIHTPGHTPGSHCLLVDGKLLSGDTLFIGGCGRCDLPGGDPTALYHSLTDRLKVLEGHTEVYPGHNYAPMPSSTIEEEKQRNPFFLIKNLEEFFHLVGVHL